MKHLLSGVAIVAALAFAAPVWAQRTGQGPGAATGTGPGVTPLTGGNATQLNQEELARVSAGNFSMPPAPRGPAPSAANPEVGPGRAARRARQ